MNEHFPDTSRLWIYQSARPFSDAEVPVIREQLQQFATRWVSHQVQMKAIGEVLHNRFIVLMADESQVSAGGCSIDSSVNFLKNLQAAHHTDLFNRMVFSYLEGEEVQTVSREDFARLYAEGRINDATPVFDTLVSNKGDFDRGFVKPLGESWHKRMV